MNLLSSYPQPHFLQRKTLSSALLLAFSHTAFANYHLVDGVSHTLTNGDIILKSSYGYDKNSAALLVRNPGTEVKGQDLIIQAIDVPNTSFLGYGVVVEQGGRVEFSGDNTSIKAQYGVYANGLGSRFSMTGGSIESALDGVTILNQASALLHGVTLKSTIAYRDAIALHGNGSQLTVTEHGATRSNIEIPGMAIHMSGASTAQIRNTDIKTNTVWVPAIYLHGTTGASTLKMDNVTLETSANGAMGLGMWQGSATLTNVDIVTHGVQHNNTPYAVYLHNAGTTATMTGGSATVHGSNAWAVGVQGGTLNMDGVTVSKPTAGNGTVALFGDGTLHFKNGVVNSAGVRAFYMRSNGSTLTLEDSKVDMDANNGIGLEMIALSKAAHASLKGSSKLNNTLTLTGDSSIGIDVAAASKVEMEKTTLTLSGKNSIGIWARSLDITNLVGETGGDGHIKLADSDVHVTGDKGVGLVFQAGAVFPGAYHYADAKSLNRIDVANNSTVRANLGHAVFARGGTNILTVNHSTLIGDRLAQASNLNRADPANPGTVLQTWGADLAIRASNQSQLFGHTDVSKDSRLTMDLQSDSTWTLRPSTAITTAANGTRRSDVSILNLDNSTVVFAAPAVGGNYQDPNIWQTLVIGSGTLGTSAIYNATDNARVRLNTLLTTGGNLNNQYTDRVLIHGDVTGTTYVTVNPVANGDFGGVTSPAGDYQNREGISLIQVAGNASVDAFKLTGGYIAFDGKPWQYRLYAYGPHPDAIDTADAGQRLVDGTGNDHWDFRLQSGSPPSTTPTPVSPTPVSPTANTTPTPVVPSIASTAPTPVPQVANYVLSPTALFIAGLQDIATMHRRLADIRITQDSNRTTFLRSYGTDNRYHANRQSNRYPYDANIRYAALQGGGSLYRLEKTHHHMRFGIAANVGQLSLNPKDVKDSRKHTLGTWGISPYITWQHINGFYLDAITLVGQFSGNVANSLRGHTSRLQGTRYGASLEAGLPIALPTSAHLTFIPQVQITYQGLKFKNRRDVDGFPVNIGSLQQTALRLGAELQLQSASAHSSNIPSHFYGKLHVVKHLDHKHSIGLGDPFHIGKFGTNLEAGLGFNAQLFKNGANAYAELNRQQRVGRYGNQSWALNLGIKLPF